MKQYNELDDLMSIEVKDLKVITYKGNLYKYIRTNLNVQRGEFTNLKAENFYNEEERHWITIYHENDNVQYVETGYGSI